MRALTLEEAAARIASAIRKEPLAPDAFECSVVLAMIYLTTKEKALDAIVTAG